MFDQKRTETKKTINVSLQKTITITKTKSSSPKCGHIATQHLCCGMQVHEEDLAFLWINFIIVHEVSLQRVLRKLYQMVEYLP